MAVITKERFTELVLQYERLVYTVCFQLVRDASAAEDLTQETFLSAYIHRESIPEGYERQWLSRVAANKAKDHLQSAWNRRTVLPGEEELARGLAPPAEEAVLRRSAMEETQAALRELKEPLPAGMPPVFAGGAVPGGGRPGPGQAGENRLYTALPGQEAAAGGTGKEWKAWYSVRTDI